MEATERVCQQCGETFFAKHPTAKFCSSTCRGRARGPREQPSPEQKAAWRRKRLENRGYRDKVNAQSRGRATVVREFLSRYKVEAGCVDCGYSENPVALDFDHVGDLKNLSVSMCKSIAQAQAEIALCEVRCANCHRIKTQERLATTARWCCDSCGLTSSSAGVGAHQKATGHSSRTRLDFI